jgi:antitoxin component YwqK of YwqJK toxin-antitoxin module
MFIVKLNLMKMKSSILLCLLFLNVSLFAQEAPNKLDAAGKKQGHWIKLDANKKKVYDGNFVNNKPVGKVSYYYESGIVKAEMNFSKNGTIAYAKLFHPGGKLMGVGKYVNEKKDSLWIYYDEEEVLLSKETYINGVKNGVSTVYYRTGQISETKTWKNGVLDGPVTKYFESGQVKYKGQCINGKVEGKVTYYHSSGKIDAEGLYKNDLKEGEWKYFAEDGKVKRMDKYVNGTIVGGDKNIITKEQQDAEKKKFEQFELKDPYSEEYKGE